MSGILNSAGKNRSGAIGSELEIASIRSRSQALPTASVGEQYAFMIDPADQTQKWTLIASEGGGVKYKATINSTSLPAGTCPADKTWIAYGSGSHSTNTENNGTGDSGPTHTGWTYALASPNYGPSSWAFGRGYGYGKGYGYGYGDCIAVKSDGATSWTEIKPASVSTVTYSHYVELDNA